MAKVLRFRRKDWGSTLTILAFSMLALTGMVGVAIDLVAFYTVRSEAQRAADAAALAGATVFVTSGCVGGASGVSCTSTGVKNTAAAQAAAIGNNNLVGGASPGISGGISACPPSTTNDVCFTVDAAGTNPRISVLVQRTSAHGNAMPTFFGQIMGISTVDISATATAEAYSPTGGTSSSASICLSCLKPFIGVDCDTSRTVLKTDPNANPVCTITGSTNLNPYIINPTSKAVVNPGIAPSGVIGENMILHNNGGPADWGTIDLGQGNGASATSAAITSCYPGNWGCGDQVQLVPGKKVGPITSGVQTLIHEGSGCNLSSGQDQITVNAANEPPVTITGGSGNPYGLSGKTITSSDSIVLVPVYDGTSTGSGSGTTFTIIGFLQLFLTDACHSGSDDTVTGVVINVIACQTLTNGCNGLGTSGNPGGGFVTGGGASAIPVRLVQ
jgi:Putative Flp pilus-assembly TadE/G-like/Putative Tad-like Flp pilus-assembly